MGKVLALVVAVAVTLALATTALANHRWAKYHWARTSNPFTVKLGDNLSTSWKTYLSEASGDWSLSSVLDTRVVAGGGSTCNPTNGRVEVCNGNFGDNGWLGIAQIWAWGTHITQGRVRVNDYYFNQSTYNTPAWRRLVMCQEVGHEFGLGHQDENFYNANLGTCMDYSADPDGPPSNEHPNQHDYDQLASIYAHLDRSTTLASAPAELPGSAPPFSQASRANGSLYVDDLGNGGRLITFVLWTPFGK